MVVSFPWSSKFLHLTVPPARMNSFTTPLPALTLVILRRHVPSSSTMAMSLSSMIVLTPCPSKNYTPQRQLATSLCFLWAFRVIVFWRLSKHFFAPPQIFSFHQYKPLLWLHRLGLSSINIRRLASRVLPPGRPPPAQSRGSSHATTIASCTVPTRVVPVGLHPLRPPDPDGDDFLTRHFVGPRSANHGSFPSYVGASFTSS